MIRENIAKTIKKTQKPFCQLNMLPLQGNEHPQQQGLKKHTPGLVWLACLLCLALAWSGLGLSCLPCQQQQPAAFGGWWRLRCRCCCCWQGRQDRPRQDQAKARHNKQASQAKAGWALGPGPCAGGRRAVVPTRPPLVSNPHAPKIAIPRCGGSV